MPYANPGATAPAPLEGRVVGARWALETRIGTGSFSEVWLARHVVTGGHKALKLLNPGPSAAPEQRARFVYEARVTAQINSPHVVTVDDIGYDDAIARAYLVMEPLRGESLYAYLSRSPYRIPAGETVAVLWQVADALDAAHAAGVVHRDVKPENVFLTWAADGYLVVKVLDFGIAKSSDGAAGALPSMAAGWSTAGFLGTPGYAPPEQIRSAHEVTAATDVFALGVSAFEMLTASPYWRAFDPLRIMAEILAGVQEPPSRRAPEGVALPAAFDAWFARACAAEPAQRFPTAGDAVAALQVALDLYDPLPLPATRVRGATDPRASGRYRIAARPSLAAHDAAPSAPPPVIPLPAAVPTLDSPASTPPPRPPAMPQARTSARRRLSPLRRRT